jgi:hypothetical protein
MTVSVDDWRGLYGESWKGTIVDEAFSHPAKFSKALIRRIYEHAMEEGWLQEGDVVVDSFGGVALGALYAMHYGLHWIGLELEQSFVNTGQACECQGMTKAEWAQYYGRWKRANSRLGYRWCPRCVANAGRVVPAPPPRLFDPDPTTSYERDSGIIPLSNPHHYEGNIEMWTRQGIGSGSGVLLQGDSRRLCEVIVGACKGVVSSPPWLSVEGTNAARKFADPEGTAERRARAYREGTIDGHYASKEAILRSLKKANDQTYGSSPGQLGSMPEGEYSAAVSSPPYNLPMSQDHSGRGGGERGHTPSEEGAFARYGNTAGQLEGLPMGSVDAAISSPPFGAGETRDRSPVQEGSVSDCITRAYTQDKQGTTPGNLATMDAAIGSPPYEAGCRHTGGEDKHPEHIEGGDYHGLGYSAAISSPPYEGQSAHPSIGSVNKDDWGNEGTDITGRRGLSGDYGETPGQLGQEQAETFWSAAKVIVQQVYALLKPGAHAIWVVKAFVRDKEIVDFPGQWQALCEHCGFDTVHYHRAWLVEDRGTQIDLWGNGHDQTVAFKSFFRRMYENKYPENSIDYEVVLCMQKH